MIAISNRNRNCFLLLLQKEYYSCTKGTMNCADRHIQIRRLDFPWLHKNPLCLIEARNRTLLKLAQLPMSAQMNVYLETSSQHSIYTTTDT